MTLVIPLSIVFKGCTDTEHIHTNPLSDKGIFVNYVYKFVLLTRERV